MPPEQFGGYATPATDLYGLGATLIYLATGRHPTELPSKDGKINFAELVKLNYSLVRWLEQIIEPSCDKRFKSATEAFQALKQSTLEKEKTRILKQPKFSRIKLHKTSEAIAILIPPQGFTLEVFFLTFVSIFWNGFMVLWTSISMFVGTPRGIAVAMWLISIPFWLVGLGLIGNILFILFGQTKLQINSKQVSLTHGCLGIKYQKPKAANRRNINAIECTGIVSEVEQREKEISPAVIIWADGKAYTLTSSIKQQTTLADKITNYNPANIELTWLAREFSEWLELPLTHLEDKRS